MRRAVLLIAIVLAGCAGARETTTETSDETTAAERVERAVVGFSLECLEQDCGLKMDPGASIDGFEVRGDTLTVRFNDAFAQVPVREGWVARVRGELERRASDVLHIEMVALGLPVEQLIPNALRTVTPVDPTRDEPAPAPAPLFVNPDADVPSAGLYGRHVALWASHGWYWEQSLGRWEWQRARLFTTVEDLFPAAFVIKYLAPMLERAGATVWMPRERDVQPHLIIADADASTPGANTARTPGWTRQGPGFRTPEVPLVDGERPFAAGTHLMASSAPAGSDTLRWTLPVPESGDYGVHLSWGAVDQASPAAEYRIHHLGGVTTLRADQRMAVGTWTFAGSFAFSEDRPAVVELTNQGPVGTRVSGDAVRLGGGMGLSERGGQTSGRPRWTEAARYHMQFSGMPRASVYNLSGGDADYTDDYRGRGEWANYLKGAPYGPNVDRSAPGLHVPVDVSVAFHTDAGVTPDSSTIGTLIIYSSEAADSVRAFPDGRSRFANRDLADLLQTQIVTDIRGAFDPEWSRRPIWDRGYSEVVRPNVPSVLLELLSHQNFADMRYGLDPRFKQTVARSIYKGLARYLASRYGLPDPVIQPLPPDHLSARWTPGGRVRISWSPRPDPLEPSALPTGYRVQVRVGNAGFDNGTATADTALVIDAPSRDQVISFRVVAHNEGGASAPSEIVAVGGDPEADRVLIVAGFDRIGPPAVLDAFPWRGFVDPIDQGVSDGPEMAFVGAQHEFDSAVPWRDDDDPGHGASWGAWEGQIVPGNSFDFPALHGRSILAAGYAFETVSDEVFDGRGGADYAALDLILGEERTETPGHAPQPEFAAFPPPVLEALLRWTGSGGALFISGAHVGVELQAAGEAGEAFGRDVLGLQHRTDRAVRTGGLRRADGATFAFHTSRNQESYAAEAPDALDPVDGGHTLLRYTESNMSAGVAFEGPHRAITWGFPFETIRTREERDRQMAHLLNVLTSRP